MDEPAESKILAGWAVDATAMICICNYSQLLIESDQAYVVACRLKDVDRQPVRLFVNWVRAAAKVSEDPADPVSL